MIIPDFLNNNILTTTWCTIFCNKQNEFKICFMFHISLIFHSVCTVNEFLWKKVNCWNASHLDNFERYLKTEYHKQSWKKWFSVTFARVNCFASKISVKKVHKILWFVFKNPPKQFTLAVIVDVLVLVKWNFCWIIGHIS